MATKVVFGYSALGGSRKFRFCSPSSAASVMGSSCSRLGKGGGVVEEKKRRGFEFGGALEQRTGSARGRCDNSKYGELHRIPGRLFGNGSSDMACLFTQQGRKGTNQDAMLVWENFNSKSDITFCGVFDGHGPYGHLVARKVRDSLPLILSTQWKANLSCDNNVLDNDGSAHGSTNSEENASINLDVECHETLDSEKSEELPDEHLPLKQSLLKAFKLMDKELKLHPTIDCFCSGSTAVTLIKQGQELVLGNIGDSRAVLATRDDDNSLIAQQLTVDLKPNLPKEAARIQQCNGRVFALQDEPEVARVWLPNSDSPGLAMARAFGDFCLKDFGLISVPDVYYRRLTERDEFIILATDGVWDVLSNKEAVDIVASAPSRTTAARALVDCANRAWRLKYPTSKNDDCAVVCLFLQQELPKSDTIIGDVSSRSHEAAQKVAKQTNGDGAEVHNSTKTGVDSEEGIHEIVPVPESAKGSSADIRRNNSTRSLAECISVTQDDEWSALEGVTRVNSLLSIPRFFSGDKRSASWRKWI
uniref:protein-serine/threonine phosphatase n=2 Tax=Kalanchoe fedtschenkoi TaxID=63787 RepID=A0A7N0TEH5_KALFE